VAQVLQSIAALQEDSRSWRRSARTSGSFRPSTTSCRRGGSRGPSAEGVSRPAGKRPTRSSRTSRTSTAGHGSDSRWRSTTRSSTA
jgi:hypothetical protein